MSEPAKIDDGGPAFPIQIDAKALAVHDYIGISIRDYFAAAALQGLLASGHFTKPCDEPINRTFHAFGPGDLNETDADEDRPSATWLAISLKCRKDYDEDATKGSFSYDCVGQSYRIADEMLAARKEGDQP